AMLVAAVLKGHLHPEMEGDGLRAAFQASTCPCDGQAVVRDSELLQGFSGGENLRSLAPALLRLTFPHQGGTIDARDLEEGGPAANDDGRRRLGRRGAVPRLAGLVRGA